MQVAPPHSACPVHPPSQDFIAQPKNAAGGDNLKADGEPKDYPDTQDQVGGSCLRALGRGHTTASNDGAADQQQGVDCDATC
jgi:hypothetical protein